MYAKANGWFNLKRYGCDEFCEYFNCTPADWEVLKTAASENHFWYLLTKSTIPAWWKLSALAAIATLENMAGVVFESTATKRHFEPMPAEDIAAMEQRIGAGYYTAEALQHRAEARAADAMAARLQKIEQRYTSEEWKQRKERDALLFVVRVTGNISDNLIFYGHNDTLCLNWQENEWSPMFTPEQIETVKARIGEVGFPVTVTIGPKG